MTLFGIPRLLAIMIAPLLTSYSVHGQVLVQTGLETWAFGVPDGFGGDHTTFAVDSIQQETVDVHGGAYAMTLLLGEHGGGTITTTALAVNAYQFYQVRFWVKGQGRIAAGLYDGRAEHDGFSPLNTPLEVNSGTWQYVMQTVLATNSTDSAEFVFDVTALGSGSVLVLDDVTINTSPLPIPVPATIQNMQETNDPSGTSPLNSVFVRTSGVITALSPNSVFIQDGTGPWRGIEVRHTPQPEWAIGDSLLVVGSVGELGASQDPWGPTRTQLITIRYVEVRNSGNPVPPPSYVEAGDLQSEAWESVLVQVPGLECLNAPDPLELHWPTASASGNVTVDDLLYYFFPTIGALYTITGIAYSNGTTVLLPRMEADIAHYTSIAEHRSAIGSCFPNPANDHTSFIGIAGTGGCTIQLLDATGRAVRTFQLDPGQHRLELGTVPNGSYVVRILENASIWNGKLLVQH